MLIRQSGEHNWRTPTVTSYDNEQAIQTIIQRSPDLLPGSTGGPMAVATELPISDAGYLDVIAVDTDGAITLVECKLKANPEIRRHVVGQVLAYAATLWTVSYETFDHAFSSRTGVSLSKRVGELAPDEWDEETFRGRVEENLRIGRFRVIIAVDMITDELARIVRYLNLHTGPDLQVLALELRYVADGGTEILLPTIYGRESVEDKPKSLSRSWDEASVFAALESCCTREGADAAHRIFEFPRSRRAQFRWGIGPQASVTARLPVGGKPVSVYSIYAADVGKGVLAVNFEYLVDAATPDQLATLATTLRKLPGAVNLFDGLEQAGFKRRPSLPFDSILIHAGAIEQLEAGLGDLIDPS